MHIEPGFTPDSKGFPREKAVNNLKATGAIVCVVRNTAAYGLGIEGGNWPLFILRLSELNDLRKHQAVTIRFAAILGWPDQPSIVIKESTGGSRLSNIRY